MMNDWEFNRQFRRATMRQFLENVANVKAVIEAEGFDLDDPNLGLFPSPVTGGFCICTFDEKGDQRGRLYDFHPWEWACEEA